MNMSLALQVLLWAFPVSFIQRFGDEWLCACEDALTHACSKGWGAWLKAWGRLVLDTSLQAPKAHAQACWAAIAGTAPSTAGMTLAGKSWVMVRHWGLRPVKATANLVFGHAVFLIAGSLVMVATYTYWSALAGLSWVFSQVVPTATQDQALAEVFRSASVWSLVALLVMALLVPSTSLAEWKRQGSRWWLAAVFFLIGIHQAAVPYLLKDLTVVAQQSLQVFVDYPAMVKTPAELPYELEEAQWDDNQRHWFHLQPDGFAAVKPELLEQWCSIKNQSLEDYRQKMFTTQVSDHYLQLLLWRGLSFRAAGEGCGSASEVLTKNQELLDYLQHHPSRFHQVWSHYTWVMPVADLLTSAMPIVQEKARPNINAYCAAAGYELHKQGLMGDRQVDPAALANQCSLLGQPNRSIEYSNFWLPGQTARLTKQVAGLPSFGQNELKQLQKDLLDRQALWTTPANP